MTPAEIILRQDRLLLAGHRMIARSTRVLSQLARERCFVLAARAHRQQADYRRRHTLIQAEFALLREIARRGDAVLH